jgi:hypothetical protein
MNWRLFSEKDKRTSAKLRNHRKNIRKKLSRRKKCVETLALLLSSPDNLEQAWAPQEAFQAQFGHLQKAHSLVSLMRLRLCKPAIVDPWNHRLPIDLPHLPVTACVLQLRRRSAVSPKLVPPVAFPLSTGLSFKALTSIAGPWRWAGLGVCQIVDRLHSFCGCWESAAELAHGMKLVPVPVHPQTIARAKHARNFWDHWHSGVAHYRAACAEGLLPRFEGNWACFDRFGLLDLLPGVRLPNASQRDFYAISMDGSFRQNTLRLIICSRNGSPLAIHPLDG